MNEPIGVKQGSHDIIFPEQALMSAKPNIVRSLNVENLFSGVDTMKTRAGITIGLRKASRLLSLIFGSMLLCVSLFSQGNAGRILGNIMDQSGGAIAGATVTVMDVQRGVSRTLTTDESGGYAAPDLVPGTYKVRVEARGFKTAERPDIGLEVGKDIRADFTLQPGEQSQTITITEALPLIETTNATLGGTLSNETINDLPLNGRNYQNLLTVRPGITRYPGGGFSTLSTNGTRPEDNVFMMDGLNNDEPFSAQSIVNGAPLFGDTTTILPVDAIQEFNTEENPRAEYGWKPGAIVNVGLKSGTNDLHGTAYAFGRDTPLDARNFFNRVTDPTPTKAPRALEQFGATAGGAIKKDKLFYFLGYEGQRFTVTQVYNVLSPTTVSLATPSNPAGDPANSIIDACKALPTGELNQLSLNLAGLNTSCQRVTPGLYPTNNGGNALGPNFVNPALPSHVREDNGIAKVDYHINDHHTLTSEYFIGDSSGNVNDAPTQLAPQWESLVHTRAQVLGENWTWAPNSIWVNESRFGFSRLYQPTFPVDNSVNPTTYGINTGVTNPKYFGMPAILIGTFGTSQLGGTLLKQQGPDEVFQFVDHVSYLHGNHAFKFGGEIRRNNVNGAAFRSANGRVRFRTLQTFLEGIPRDGRLLVGDPVRHLHNEGFAAFLQDDWRVTPKLTVNLGVRYELNTVMVEAHNLLGNFDPAVGLVQVGQQIKSPYNGDHNNFAPRLGVAWDVTGKGTTVIRAGGGIVYEEIAYNTFLLLNNQLGINIIPTGGLGVLPGNGTIDTGALSLPGSAINWTVAGPVFSSANHINCGASPCNILSVAPNLRTPYVTSWTLNVQHAFTNNLSLELGYVGNHGTKLISIEDINQVNPATGLSAFGTKFPFLAAINQVGNAYHSNYNGLQATLTQRTSHGLSFVVGYTYAHALDQSSSNWGYGPAQDLNNLRAEYGNSDFDIRHRFTFTMSYAIPGKKSFAQLLEGWKLNSIVTLQTGQPWGAQDTGSDIAGTGEVNNPAYYGDRWDFFGNPSDFTSGPTAIPYIDPTNFVVDGNNHVTGVVSGAPAGASTCLARAVGQAMADQLGSLGCYVVRHSVLIPPAPGTFGTASRGIFRDSGFRNWDLSVTKSWKVGERVTSQFRAEFFNILNHPNFANPYGGANGYANNDPSTGPGMGCGCATPDVAASNPILGSGGAREIQLGLKFIF
ncbi:MAG: TonB-dependent receptor [Acidobacteriia bacterium]|nr:TonB-dependent receptor [Terriglobia bacterium]